MVTYEFMPVRLNAVEMPPKAGGGFKFRHRQELRNKTAQSVPQLHNFHQQHSSSSHKLSNFEQLKAFEKVVQHNKNDLYRKSNPTLKVTQDDLNKNFAKMMSAYHRINTVKESLELQKEQVIIDGKKTEQGGEFSPDFQHIS
jgi:hypothetical protein